MKWVSNVSPTQLTGTWYRMLEVVFVIVEMKLFEGKVGIGGEKNPVNFYPLWGVGRFL